MNNKIRIGIIGAGVFGHHHARKCYDNAHFDLIGIYDRHPNKTQALAQQYNVQAYGNFGDMLEDIDALIIACNASHHGTIAIEALGRNCHCLIEKPFTHCLNKAQQVIDISEKNNLIVQVGHQERFVVNAIGLDKITEKPKAIKAWRMGYYTDRGRDVSVTMDLMIHDLDLVLWLNQSFPNTVNSHNHHVNDDIIDEMHVNLGFDNSLVELSASRISKTPKRIMEIEYPSGTVHVDFNNKLLQHNTPFDLDSDFGTSPLAQDSLAAAAQSFAESILDSKRVAINAQDGYQAVRLALMIDEDAKLRVKTS